MNDLLIDLLRGFTNSNDWSVLLPEVLLALLALVLLLADILLPKGKYNWIYCLSIVGQLTVLGLICSPIAIGIQPGSDILFGGLIEQTTSSQWMRGFFSLSALFITYL